MCSAELKVRNFQLRTEPIRLLNISNFSSIVKDELSVLQQSVAVGLSTETRIKFTLCWRFVLYFSFTLHQVSVFRRRQC
ncbi:MAG TPA: hypothetical protein VIK55_16695 [Paludibacter sp.]